MRITVNNNDYLLQWGMGAILQYCDDMGCEIAGLDLVTEETVEGQKALLCLVMAAIKNGCKLENKPCDINDAHLMAFIDNATQEEWLAVLNDFIDSRYQGKTMRERLYGDIPQPVVENKKKTKVKVSPK